MPTPDQINKKICARQKLKLNSFRSADKLRHKAVLFLKDQLKARYDGPDLVKVDDPGFVAHLGRLVVVAPDCGESHLGVGRAHRDAERGGGGPPVRGRVGVAHHQAFTLQDDRLRVVLSSHQLGHERPAEQQQETPQHHDASLLLLLRFREKFPADPPPDAV